MEDRNKCLGFLEKEDINRTRSVQDKIVVFKINGA